MTPNWTDAQDWLDILDHMWIGFVVIVAATIPSVFAARNHRSIQQVERKTDAIRDQVENGHKDAPPLRVDLDRAIASLDQLGREVRGLRQDLMAEEERRRIQINDLRHELEHRTGKHRRI